MTAVSEETLAEGTLPEGISLAPRIPHARFVDLRDGALTIEAAPEDAVRLAAPIWQRWYVLALIVLDALAMIVGGLLATWVWFENIDQPLKGLSYNQYVLAAVVPWIGAIAVSRGYEPRFLGLGSEEFRRVGNASMRFTALSAVVAFALDVDPARGMVAVALPLCGLITLVLRYCARQVLHRMRSTGTACHRVLLIGEATEVAVLERRLLASPHAGLRVVGHCGPSRGGSLVHVRAAIEACGADTVAVAHSPGDVFLTSR